MRRIMVMCMAVLFSALFSTAASYADKKESFPGKGQGSVHSNAPSTGSQVKGKERAHEVGKDKKKGLDKQELGTRKEMKEAKEKGKQDKNLEYLKRERGPRW
ncbi:MAG: hypothetical protein Q8P84_07430 [Deltaproteobacteria bacterium]|nr:hypothetical protein [Deltaproteobacteria bacterium]